MPPLSIDDVLEQIRSQLNLSRETEWELIEEIRCHLEDAVDAARRHGKDENTALLKAAEDFGMIEASQQLQKLHGEFEMTEVLLMLIAPIVCTVVMRWVFFSAEGTLNGWQPIFPRTISVALSFIILLLPLVQLRRWPYASFGWLFFWGISMIFIAFPAIRTW